MFRCQDAIAVSIPTATVQLTEILAAVDQLSAQDKTALVNHILGGSGLSALLNYPLLPYRTHLRSQAGAESLFSISLTKQRSI